MDAWDEGESSRSGESRADGGLVQLIPKVMKMSIKHGRTPEAEDEEGGQSV